MADPADPAERCSSNAEFVEAVARENVRSSARGILKQSDVLREMHDAGDIAVVGAMYDIASGEVKFFDDAD